MKLAEYLRREEMTGEQLAVMAGMPSSTISRILNGRRRPGLDVMQRIARATGYRVSALEDFVPEEPSSDGGGASTPGIIRAGRRPLGMPGGSAA
jgi:transcriptional regulator with XRE-family HTH domain